MIVILLAASPEVIDGTIAYINNKDIDIDGLMEHIKAPWLFLTFLIEL